MMRFPDIQPVVIVHITDVSFSMIGPCVMLVHVSPHVSTRTTTCQTAVHTSKHSGASLRDTDGETDEKGILFALVLTGHGSLS